MIPSLPGPGTPAFAELVKGLEPFGIEPSAVTIDAPSARLSDVVLGIVLLEKRVVVRITASSFELFVTSLFVGDDSALIEIAHQILTAVPVIDAATEKAADYEPLIPNLTRLVEESFIMAGNILAYLEQCKASKAH